MLVEQATRVCIEFKLNICEDHFFLNGKRL